ncbi:hypothetical protein BXZ70DRAFT_500245 [Cristinia sonorae]|uniref:DUF6534 domain-containing protein n=1 Tax=Cristinia sonorae TaxID=1940300 RepID=A0A8K0UH65_9AGAR|nr:hypothetical protein BXZ70DRAFT_500245 [Cristinia sonorae]
MDSEAVAMKNLPEEILLLLGPMVPHTQLGAVRTADMPSLHVLCRVFRRLTVSVATYDGFRVFVTGWGDSPVLDDIGLFWLSIPVLTGIVACLTQLFYAWRIHQLSERNIWDGLACIQIGHISDLSRSFVFKNIIANLWTGSNVLCDVSITISMLYYLWSAKKRSLAPRSSTTLVRLIKFTVESGLIIAAMTVINLTLFQAIPHTLLYVIIGVPSGKIYSNCLLAVLNSRLLGGRAEVRDQTNTAFVPLDAARYRSNVPWRGTPEPSPSCLTFLSPASQAESASA